MLHHVSLEIAPDDVERTVEFFGLLGFERIAAPDPIAPFVTWLEASTTQIHLIHTPEPTTPTLGHPRLWSATSTRGSAACARPASKWRKPMSCGESGVASRSCPAASE